MTHFLDLNQSEIKPTLINPKSTFQKEIYGKIVEIELHFPRALYMGELRKNTTSTGTITKKPGYFGKIETVGTKKNFHEVIFFYSLIKLNFSLI